MNKKLLTIGAVVILVAGSLFGPTWSASAAPKDLVVADDRKDCR
ncbi:MAG: hypothetical protein AVDCRST_MAG93-3317 [uncultured Chloroflexia bacterium]|uniref:Uncharacterized protein n=1 Tax=uncultured Chloroflexia bacterium TaxID=1672391 RepID=A0A6J4JNM5_9CHLR|nr:MAG: hypothetical protein AVDCRST_MAG93-3317 [uncultured Chloroflexia bacterium]